MLNQLAQATKALPFKGVKEDGPEPKVLIVLNAQRAGGLGGDGVRATQGAWLKTNAMQRIDRPRLDRVSD